MKKINSGLPYWCDSSQGAVRMGTDMLFPPRIFSKNYSTNLRDEKKFGYYLSPVKHPWVLLLLLLLLSFNFWNKAEEAEHVGIRIGVSLFS